MNDWDKNEKPVKEKRLHKEISLYTVFGVLTTVVGIGAYKIAMDFGLHYAPANFVSFVAAVTFAWVTNRKYVFQESAQGFLAVVLESVRFAGSRVLTFLIETAGLYILIDSLHQNAFLSKVVCNGFVIVLNYILSKYFVFRK